MTLITSRRTIMTLLCLLGVFFLVLSFMGGRWGEVTVENQEGPQERDASQTLGAPEPVLTGNRERPEMEPEGDEFFMEFRLERDRRRAQEIELLQSMFNSTDDNSEIKQEVQYKLLAITNAIDQELALETLIMAKGYADAVAVVQPESVTVVVRDGNFTEEDAARIADLVTRTTGVPLSKVTVFAKE
ncbi:MAG: SpoIIIAH-like family protein [Clostridia bacterium]|nr:SpoIIIAH-like family protein [Clostridia bacterium]